MTVTIYSLIITVSGMKWCACHMIVRLLIFFNGKEKTFKKWVFRYLKNIWYYTFYQLWQCPSGCTNLIFSLYGMRKTLTANQRCLPFWQWWWLNSCLINHWIYKLAANTVSEEKYKTSPHSEQMSFLLISSESLAVSLIWLIIKMAAKIQCTVLYDSLDFLSWS